MVPLTAIKKKALIKEFTKKYRSQGSLQFSMGLLHLRGSSTWGLSPDLSQIQTVALHLRWQPGRSEAAGRAGVMVKSGVMIRPGVMVKAGVMLRPGVSFTKEV